MPLPPIFRNLSAKIVAILVGFLFVALMAIGMTLYSSWQLEGGSAAINDAGSERMRSYRIAYLLQQLANENQDQVEEKDVLKEIVAFELILEGLERGDPARPLFLPQNEAVRGKMRALQHQWRDEMKPLIMAMLDNRDPTTRARMMDAYRPYLTQFVSAVNELVFLVEQDSASKTAWLRSYQLGLVAAALAGTIVLIYLFFLLVIRPVTTLHEGIQRMAAADFSVRLPVESKDEFGELTQGFNAMADHLQNLYNTLEQRVADKTHRLEERNQELALLYEITAFLNETTTVEELCRAFVKKLAGLLNADGAAIWLAEPGKTRMNLASQQGLSETFIQHGTGLHVGECLCGQVAADGKAISCELPMPSEAPVLGYCRQDGFNSVSAIPIRFQRQIIGVFNLFYRQPHIFHRHEIHLMETLCQHLGVAIENQRLIAREKEMAISEERNLLAQELHDSIAQSLAFLNIQVQLLADSLRHGNSEEALDTLSQIREGVQESYDHVRELLVHFRTRMDHVDLGAAIRSSLEKFEGQTGIAAGYTETGSGIPLEPEDELQALHIIQEALSNVRKHARASRVQIETRRDSDRYVISVKDDGQGFDPGRMRDDADMHVGLRIMKERAHRIGGYLDVSSRPGGGTEVTLTLTRLKAEAA
jgi:two-component system nitrate/nitrite sensor histidine kinase NarX